MKTVFSKTTVILWAILTGVISQTTGLYASESKYGDTYTNPAVSHQEKWTLAKSAKSLSQNERNDLHALISKQQDGDAWYYALSTLVVAKDTPSAEIIEQEFLSNTNRYYALALGILGYSNAVPMLKEMLYSTDRDYVRQDILVALRLLNAESEEAAPTSGANHSISIELSASTTNIVVGEPFILTATVENDSDDAISIGNEDDFFAQTLRIETTDKQFVFPVRLYTTHNNNKPRMKQIPPQEKVVFEEECVVAVETLSNNSWPEIIPAYKSLVTRGASKTWAFDIANYNSSQDVNITMYLVCEVAQYDSGKISEFTNTSEVVNLQISDKQQ